ncbi:MAG TPA: hypothetical protein VHJ18_04365 [Streptosporangiaceae bacterium]|jgi:hypothetical protein|nr:hypothetical protein [Streptosporangiaceae bacterium]
MTGADGLLVRGPRGRRIVPAELHPRELDHGLAGQAGVTGADGLPVDE